MIYQYFRYIKSSRSSSSSRVKLTTTEKRSTRRCTHHRQVSFYKIVMLMQNLIKLSAAVHELWC